MEKDAMKGAGLSKTVSDTILPRILNLYASRATPQDFEIYAPHATFEDPLMQAQGTMCCALFTQDDHLMYLTQCQINLTKRDDQLIILCKKSTTHDAVFSATTEDPNPGNPFVYLIIKVSIIEDGNINRSMSRVKEIKSAFYSLAKVFRESKIVDYNIEENVISPGHTEILIDNKQYYKFCGKDINVVSLIKLYTEDGKIVRHEDWWDKKPFSNKETSPFVGRINEFRKRASMLVTHAFMGFGKDPAV